MNVTVLRESWRAHPLSWIHRAEARSVAEELRRAGHTVLLRRFHRDRLADWSPEPPLLRLSDPVMFAAVQALTRAGLPFYGPSASVMQRCYDKYEAYRIASARGIDCPATVLADEGALPFPLVLKPRCGSDSIGVRVFPNGSIPARVRTDGWIVQQHVRGVEITIGVLHGRAGMPLRVLLREGTPYSFFRKYLLRPKRVVIADPGFADRVRRVALETAEIFNVDWAARIDLIQETATGRLRFLECDVAPLIGARSAFAASLEAAGIDRAAQLRRLLTKPVDPIVTEKIPG